MKHHKKIQLRWDDLDAFQHVNNAAYLTYAQEARADFTWYSRVGAGKNPIFKDMVVARAEVDFLEPIYDGITELDVAIFVERIGTSSFILVYEMSSGGVINAMAKTVQVGVSMETKKSRPLTDEEREFLAPYLQQSSEGDK
ncbi:MAG: thioesterase family protein [Actinomycetota bacterium]